MLFDTHAHYDDHRFDADRDALLATMPAHNVGLILNPGCTVETSQTAIRIAETHDFVYAAVGIHPEYSMGVTQDDLDCIRALSAHPKVKAIGEIGLDYYWEKQSPETTPPRARQKELLKQFEDSLTGKEYETRKSFFERMRDLFSDGRN